MNNHSQTPAENIRRYIDRMSGSIEGSQGSAALYAVAVVLRRGFNLDHETSLMHLKEWNDTKALPLWSERELVAKLNSAARDGKMPYGQLLRDPRQTYANSRPAPLPPKPPRTARIYSPAELEAKAAQREKWESPIPPTLDYIDAVSHLRHSSRDCVEAMVRDGLMQFEYVFDWADRQKHLCFVILGENLRQARRLDGIQQTTREGERIKSKNIPGSLATGFIWKPSLDAARNPILLVEGVIGYLEALTAIRWAGPYPNRWEVMAAHSANASRFCNVPEILREISGRRVRIIQDSDPGGRTAALDWGHELTTAGCQVELVTLPPGMKDLGDLLTAPLETSHHEMAAILAL